MLVAINGSKPIKLMEILDRLSFYTNNLQDVVFKDEKNPTERFATIGFELGKLEAVIERLVIELNINDDDKLLYKKYLNGEIKATGLEIKQ